MNMQLQLPRSKKFENATNMQMGRPRRWPICDHHATNMQLISCFDWLYALCVKQSSNNDERRTFGKTVLLFCWLTTWTIPLCNRRLLELGERLMILVIFCAVSHGLICTGKPPPLERSLVQILVRRIPRYHRERVSVRGIYESRRPREMPFVSISERNRRRWCNFHDVLY